MWCLCHNWRKFNSSQNARVENTFHLLAYHKYYHRSSRGSLLATLYYIAQINFPSATFLRCPPSTYHNIINFLRHPMASHRFFPRIGESQSNPFPSQNFSHSACGRQNIPFRSIRSVCGYWISGTTGINTTTTRTDGRAKVEQRVIRPDE